MALKVFLLLMIVFTMSAAGSSGQGRAPSCRDVKETSVCTQEYTPVCGDDGVTYPNECSMCLSRLSSYQFWHTQNDVKEIHFCTQDYTPVCGTDGVTYSNECALCLSRQCNPALMIAKDGPCDSDKTVS